jgi:hypothetical protein
MGIHHKHGYSADVKGFFVCEHARIRLAKTNGCTFVVADPCELSPGTEGDLVIVVDGNTSSRRVVIDDGIMLGQKMVGYRVAAPF